MLKIEHYFEAFLIIFLIGLFGVLIHPYIISIFMASAIVFLIYPFFKAILGKVKNRSFASLIVTLIVMIFIIAPLYIVSLTLISQSSLLVQTGQNTLDTVDLGWCTFDFCSNIEKNLRFVDLKIDNLTGLVADYLSNSSYSLFDSLSTFFFNVFIFILSLFFFLKDGEKFVTYMRRIIPMKDSYKDSLFLRFKDVSMAVFGNNILVAIIQGSLVGIGFLIFGISSPFFWAVIASFLALLPFLGAAIVWAPAAIFMILSGNYISGILLFVYGFFIVGLADNVARPLLLRKKIEVHPLLIFLSIFGGIEVFGFLTGIFLGPIIISLLISVLQLYKLEFY